MKHEIHAQIEHPNQRSLDGGFRQCTMKIIRAPLERTWSPSSTDRWGGKRPWKSYSKRSKQEKIQRRVKPMYNEKGSSWSKIQPKIIRYHIKKQRRRVCRLCFLFIFVSVFWGSPAGIGNTIRRWCRDIRQHPLRPLPQAEAAARW